MDRSLQHEPNKLWSRILFFAETLVMLGKALLAIPVLVAIVLTGLAGWGFALLLQLSLDGTKRGLWRAWRKEFRVRNDYGANQEIAFARGAVVLPLLALDNTARQIWLLQRRRWLRACRRAGIGNWRLRTVACLTS